MEQSKLDRIAEWSVDLEISGTAIKSAGEAHKIHVADSLAGLEVPAVQAAKSIVDIGSGAGFPGLVLAVMLPDAQITLVDSVRKKMEAAGKFARELELENVECVWGRAEEIAALGSPHREAYDVVTARALAQLGVLLEYSAPLLRESGHLVAWKGLPEPSELAAARAAAEILGFETGQLTETKPFKGSRTRHFYVARKIRPTDERFPRRAGVALKKPLA
ncbi:MAG: 16S rRNA (guanine(527)-N(7))-methyltransferase RsmG [Thermoleophilaceae bacterium]|nr:16S rRNA (guanine(527)-N(7))-methyltransferase RsmG [Thermoleophilaceae bacterium]